MRLMKTSLSLLTLILGLSVMAHANTDLAVVTKQHLDSRGGSDRVSGLQRYEMKGTITCDGEAKPMKVWWKYPNKLRVEIGRGDKDRKSVV